MKHLREKFNIFNMAKERIRKLEHRLDKRNKWAYLHNEILFSHKKK